jgi:hypothetical protein
VAGSALPSSVSEALRSITAAPTCKSCPHLGYTAVVCGRLFAWVPAADSGFEPRASCNYSWHRVVQMHARSKRNRLENTLTFGPSLNPPYGGLSAGHVAESQRVTCSRKPLTVFLGPARHSRGRTDPRRQTRAPPRRFARSLSQVNWKRRGARTPSHQQRSVQSLDASAP